MVLRLHQRAPGGSRAAAGPACVPSGEESHQGTGLTAVVRELLPSGLAPSHQLLANPKAELCAFHNGTWLRIACSLVEDDRVEAKKSMLDAYPNLRRMYDENDGNTMVLYMENATATFSSFTAAPEVVTF